MRIRLRNNCPRVGTMPHLGDQADGYDHYLVGEIKRPHRTAQVCSFCANGEHEIPPTGNCECLCHGGVNELKHALKAA